jgi:hypothetical protein
VKVAYFLTSKLGDRQSLEFSFENMQRTTFLKKNPSCVFAFFLSHGPSFDVRPLLVSPLSTPNTAAAPPHAWPLPSRL